MIRSSHHIVLLYPLWLGTTPALLKSSLEQVFRYGYVIEKKTKWTICNKLSGSCDHGHAGFGVSMILWRGWSKNLERKILKFYGIKPVHESQCLFGMIGRCQSGKTPAMAQADANFGCKGHLIWGVKPDTAGKQSIY